MSTIPFDPFAVSNCGACCRYVVQALSNTDGWQDTARGGDTPEAAGAEARELLADTSKWMNGTPTQCRIVPRKGPPARDTRPYSNRFPA